MKDVKEKIYNTLVPVIMIVIRRIIKIIIIIRIIKILRGITMK